MSGVNFCAALMLPLIFILPLQEHFRHFISEPKILTSQKTKGPHLFDFAFCHELLSNI